MAESTDVTKKTRKRKEESFVQKPNKMKKVSNLLKSTSRNYVKLFEKLILTPNTITKDLEELSRRLCKSLQLSCVEICLTDKDLLNKLNRVEPQSRRHMEPFISMGKICVFRTGFQNAVYKVNQRSIAIAHLGDFFPDIRDNRMILFKMHALYIPILEKWRQGEDKVVGVVILSNKFDGDESQDDDSESTHQFANFQKLSIFKEFVQVLNYYFGLCILHLERNMFEAKYKGITRIGKRFGLT